MSIGFKTPAKRLAWAAAACVALHAVPAATAQTVMTAAANSTPLQASLTTNRLVIKYRSAVDLDVPSTSTQAMATATATSRGTVLSHLRRLTNGAHVYRLDRWLSVAEVQQLVDALSNGNADIEYAEPDVLLQPQAVPNDPLLKYQWDLFDPVSGINAPAAWDKSIGAGVVVAVIDTGVRPHADLAANLLPGYDFIGNATVSNDGDGRDSDPYDPGDWTVAGACDDPARPAVSSSWHGTHVAGTVAALTNNANGVAGVAYGARVLPARVLGRCGGFDSDIADAIVWASGAKVKNVPSTPTPARVINLSLGGLSKCARTTQNAINTARANGAVVVVAAGNKSMDAASFSPANCQGVVTVAATNHFAARASYSNYGNRVDLAAPGGENGMYVGIPSTYNLGATVPGDDGYVFKAGTSMAAPHVSAVAALMLSRNPSLTPDEVEDRLKSSARAFPGACDQCGTGLLDANAAVDAAGLPAILTLAEQEGNNTFTTAQRVPALPADVSGTIAVVGDKDHFRVQIPVGARLQAKLTTGAASDYSLKLFTRNGTLLASSMLNGLGVPEELTYTNTGNLSKFLVLQVRRADGKYGATAPYALSVGMY
ncbi:S8 family peptidase [Azohydromonas australica]|uniref:S8 family peptidase n=1 Tax=Azohydromonas australica TaxID=364039 RepID=UPI0003F8F178|nr:S8 family peptidase [Azohydromonas australica]